MDGIATAIGKLTDALAKNLASPAEKAADTKEVQTSTKDKSADVSKSVLETATKDLAEKAANVRVKEAAEQYSATKGAMMYPMTTKAGTPHPMAGRQVCDYSMAGQGGQPLEEPSQRDKAVTGAYCKMLCAARVRGGSRMFGYQALPDHDKSLIQYGMNEMEWSGATDGGPAADINRRKLTPFEQKALLDEAVSGGFEAVPAVFDDQVIQTPLLYGQLYPLVNTVPITRGSRIEGDVIGQVTGTWGSTEGTATTLFNTASYVSAFDTTIYKWRGAITIGLDFLSDSPVNFGQIVTQQYGNQLLHDLDDVVATGNGTTQPEGVMNKATVTSVAWGGATSIGNYESLRFGVAEAEHQGNVISSAVFCGTETSYARVKGLPVGAADARRLFGTGTMGTNGYDNHSIMDRPFKINTSLTNAQLFYAILARYRMYRRAGLVIKTTTEGQTLMLQNLLLMIAEARYGGQLERGACGAVTTTAPA